jgi:hypothetical protein
VAMSANDKQIAGTHYKDLEPEPWDVVLNWGLGYLDGTALKYIARWRNKNGVEDLKKAVHFIQKLIEEEEKKEKENAYIKHPDFGGARSVWDYADNISFQTLENPENIKSVDFNYNISNPFVQSISDRRYGNEPF